MKKAIVSILMLLFLFSGCSIHKNVPSFVEAQQIFEEYEALMLTVTNYVQSLPYQKVYISSTNGVMQADLDYITIEDESVIDAIGVLLGSHTFECISKRENTVYFPIEYTFHECSSGIAFAMKEGDLPIVQFMTECTSLGYSSWYYYVADYNLWRVEHN